MTPVLLSSRQRVILETLAHGARLGWSWHDDSGGWRYVLDGYVIDGRPVHGLLRRGLVRYAAFTESAHTLTLTAAGWNAVGVGPASRPDACTCRDAASACGACLAYGSRRPELAAGGPESQKTSGSGLERHLLASVRAYGLPEPELEFRFHPTRKWRLDLAWPAQRLAVEIEGGIYRGGGHTSVVGLKRDIEKGNALTMAGWRVLRFHGDQVKSGEATALIAEALETLPADAGRAGEG